MDIYVAGSTGLVGKAVCRALAKDGRAAVTALRRKGAKGGDGPIDSGDDSKVSILIREFDYESQDSYESLDLKAGDVMVNCLGTTHKKAGSKTAFRQVDLVYPDRLLQCLEQADVQKTGDSKACSLFVSVSSVGAGWPVGNYLGTKHALEKRIQQSPVAWCILRPSLLLGQRTDDPRFLEDIGQRWLGKAAPWFQRRSLLSAFAPIHAERLAQVIVQQVLGAPRVAGAGSILEGNSLRVGHEGLEFS